jgi:rhodanese-related sulfurtransferase
MKASPGHRINAADVDTFIRDQAAFFLDVREPKELHELGTLEGYYNIPFGQLEQRLDELPRDRPILTA